MERFAHRWGVAAAVLVAVTVLASPAGATRLPGRPPADPEVHWDQRDHQSGIFSSQRVGSRSAPRTLRLTNSDVLPLDVHAVFIEAISSPYPSDGSGEEGKRAFSATTDCPGAVLLPGAACEVQVSFAPLHAGPSQAALRVTHDGVSGGFSLHLGGEGVIGMYMAGATGEVIAFGDARSYGDLSHVDIDTPVLAMATTPSGEGYWLAEASGRVHPFGDAARLGSADLPEEHLVTGMATTPSGGGYWLVADDGSVHGFGDAGSFGSAAGVADAPVVGISATPSGRGYWLLDLVGGVHAFGDAGHFGSAADLPPRYPITAMTPTPSGQGYWLLDARGGAFSFGDAEAFSTTDPAYYDHGPPDPYVAIEAVPAGQGFWYGRMSGQVRAQGDAQLGFTSLQGYGNYHPAPGSFAVDMASNVKPFVVSPEAGEVRVVGHGGLRTPPQVCLAIACVTVPPPPDTPPIPAPLPVPPSPTGPALPRPALLALVPADL